MPCRLFRFKKKKTQPPDAGPYRTAAVIPVEPKPPTPKRAFKMPLTIDKHSKTFGFLIPSGVCFVGIGFIYDALPVTMGLGTKWGFSAVLAMIAVFFICMAIGNADKKE